MRWSNQNTKAGTLSAPRPVCLAHARLSWLFVEPAEASIGPYLPSRITNKDIKLSVLLEHGQIVGRLIYETMLERPKALYGERIGSSYQAQTLKLSKHFRA